MIHEKTFQIKASPHDTIKRLAELFIVQGYKIIEKTENTLEMVQVVAPMNNHCNALCCVSSFKATVQGDSLVVVAEMNGFNKLFIGLGIMIGLMSIASLTLLGFLFRPENWTLTKALFISLAPFLLWPVLLPLMHSFTRNNGIRVLDVQINNICNFG